MTSTTAFPAAALVLLLAATSASLGSASQEHIQDSTRQADSTEDYCNRGVSITNDIRRKYQGKGKYVGQGQGDLVVGTVSMLDNCVSHSKLMADRHANGFNNFGGSGGHQDLGEATSKVGCGLFITGENIAMFSASMASDPAVQCMEQWEESEGHLDNIMSKKEGDYVAVGVYNDGERWWCTQTFANKGDGSCPRVGQSSENVAPVEPSPRSENSDPTSPDSNAPAPDTFVTATTAAPETADPNTPAPDTFVTVITAAPETADPNEAAPATFAPATTVTPAVVPVSSAAPAKTTAAPIDSKPSAPSSGHCKGSTASTPVDSKTAAPATTAPATTAPSASGQREWNRNEPYGARGGNRYGSYGRRGGMYGYYPYGKY